MSKASIISALSITAALVLSSVSQAQTVQTQIGDTAETALPPPLSITQRYVPPPKEKTSALRAPLTLLVDDSSTVVAAAETTPEETAPAARQPVVSEEVGNRPAIAALAHGRLAITVSSGEHR